MITKEEIIAALQIFYNEHGRSPSRMEFKPIYNPKTVEAKFGNWNKALEAAGLPRREKCVNTGLILCCDECDNIFYKRQKEMKKTKHNFCSKSCAASYNNRHKTKGNRRSKLEVWLEKQFGQFYDFEVIYNKVHPNIKYELDIFIPTLNLAIELNGIFHHEPIYGEEKLTKIQRIDQKKIKRCSKYNIEMLVIDTQEQRTFKPETSKIFWDLIRWKIESLLFLKSFASLSL
jgi:hypothetical protein